MADIFKNALNTATQIDYNELNSDGSYRISDDDLMIKLSDANKNKDQNAINKINKAIEERTQKKFGKPSVQESQEMLNKGRIETAKQVSEVPVDQWNAIKQRIKDAKASDSDMATAYTMWKKGYYNEAGPKTLEWFKNYEKNPDSWVDEVITSDEPIETSLPVKEEKEVPQAEISDASNSNAKLYKEVKNKKELKQLEKDYPDGFYDEEKKIFYYNDPNVTKRQELAEEDKKENRTPQEARAKSTFERDITNKSGFDAVDYKGDPVYTTEELEKALEKYGKDDEELASVLEKELESRAENKDTKKSNETVSEEDLKTVDSSASDSKKDYLLEKDPEVPAILETKDPAEKQALETKKEQLNEALDEAGLRREDLEKEWDNLISKNRTELNKYKDAAELSKYLPTFAIAHYLNGDFGERKSPKAVATLGYFLVDKLGAALVNASQLARGMSPTAKSALEEYNAKMMDAAINRDDKTKTKVIDEQINDIIKNSDALRQAGYDTEVVLGNDLVSDYLRQHASQIDDLTYLKLKQQSAKWFDKLSDEDKQAMDRLFLMLSSNPDDRYKSIAEAYQKTIEAKYAETEADKAEAEYRATQAKMDAQLVDVLAELGIKERQQKMAYVNQEIDNLRKSGELTSEQAELLKKDIIYRAKEINWYDANQVKGAVADGVSAIIKGLK